MEFGLGSAHLVIEPAVCVEDVALEVIDTIREVRWCRTFVVTPMLPPLALLFSALNAEVSIRNSSHGIDGRSQAVHVPNVIARTHLDGHAIDADVPVMLLTAAYLKSSQAPSPLPLFT